MISEPTVTIWKVEVFYRGECPLCLRNRNKSDQKRAEAEEIGRQLDELEKQA